MSRKKRQEVSARDVTSLNMLAPVLKSLARLHDEGCARDRAGNRKLHFDEYCALVLLYLFNPILTSLRGIQQASELPNVQKKLGCSRAALGSLSEATSVFDAERLTEVIRELGGQLRPLKHDPRLEDLEDLLLLCDGTILKALPRMSQAMLLKRQTGSGSAGHPSDGWLRIATNLLDVPAEIIALIYHYRWTIEIFFRFFKHVLGCRHLLSHDENGIKIQSSCAIIACLLISLWTGRKPTLRTYEMICHYFTGLATEKDLLNHICRLKERDAAKTTTV